MFKNFPTFIKFLHHIPMRQCILLQDAKRVAELLRNLRQKRLQKLDRRMGDLKYLCSIGLDAKDVQLAKDAGHLENRIAHWDIKLTTAKFLHNKVRVAYVPRPPVFFVILFYTLYRLLQTRTATRSSRIRKRVVHVYSPGVAATRHVWPAAAAAAAADVAVYR